MQGLEVLLGTASAQSSWPSTESSITAMPPSRERFSEAQVRDSMAVHPQNLSLQACCRAGRVHSPNPFPHDSPSAPQTYVLLGRPSLSCLWYRWFPGRFHWRVLGAKSRCGSRACTVYLWWRTLQLHWLPHLCGQENGSHSAPIPPCFISQGLARLTFTPPGSSWCLPLPVYGTTYPASQPVLA